MQYARILLENIQKWLLSTQREEIVLIFVLCDAENYTEVIYVANQLGPVCPGPKLLGEMLTPTLPVCITSCTANWANQLTAATVSSYPGDMLHFVNFVYGLDGRPLTFW